MTESTLGLQGFGKYDELYNLGFPAQVMGYESRRAGGLINTINARVRVAKSFNGIQLDGYEQPSVDGYSAIFQVFLTYSAFERYLKLIGLEYPSEIENLLPSYDVAKTADQIRDLDNGWKFTDFLYEHSDKQYMKDWLDRFKLGDEDNIAVLAAAVRHIFAHGHLTAYAQGARSQIIVPVCRLLSDFLLHFMDCEFSKNIEFVYAREENRGLTRRLDRKKTKESNK